MRHRSRVRAAAPLALLLLLGGSASARSQSAVPGAPLGTVVPAIEERAAVDSFLALVPLRATGEIDAAIEQASGSERSAMNRRRLGDRNRRRAREAQEEQLIEIDRTVQAIRIADDLGQKDRKAGLQAELELRRRYRDVIAVHVEVLEQEVMTAEQEERLAVALRARLVAERELAARRAEWRALQAAADGASHEDRRKLEERLLQQLRDYLEAQRDEEREIEKLARVRQGLAGKRIELVESRRRLFDD